MPDATASHLDAAARDAADAAIERQDAGAPDANGQDAAAGDSLVAETQVFEESIIERSPCNTACAARATDCDDDYSWAFGAFIGGGRARYAAGQRTAIFDCDQSPPETQNGNALTSWECACR